MPDLRDLYHEVIIDHSKSPRNFREIAQADRKAQGHNPLCGDELTVFVKLNGDIIEDISFIGSGCAISKASASMMTTHLKGKTRAEAEATFREFHRMLTEQCDSEPDKERLGKLVIFAGVSEFPVRVKCATLPWHTMHSALEGKNETVTTE